VDLMHDFATALTQRQARQISRLTVVSTVFLPIIFLTGFFGTKWMGDIIESRPAVIALTILLPIVSVLVTALWLARRRLA
jgi:magnesium transporter